jgi:DnaJ-class molecular chaperone
MKNKTEILIEKCICCNGSGKQQRFDEIKNRWVKSDDNCELCKGKGERQYILISNDYDFIGPRKSYL